MVMKTKNKNIKVAKEEDKEQIIENGGNLELGGESDSEEEIEEVTQEEVIEEETDEDV